ncbi:hypothetical protein Q3G72_014802 [Acer saccharum]|nr:hypothetical protein Q3G72_014802 [Acer saccharum]
MRLRSTAFLPEVRRRDSSENRVQEHLRNERSVELFRTPSEINQGLPSKAVVTPNSSIKVAVVRPPEGASSSVQLIAPNPTGDDIVIGDQKVALPYKEWLADLGGRTLFQRRTPPQSIPVDRPLPSLSPYQNPWANSAPGIPFRLRPPGSPRSIDRPGLACLLLRSSYSVKRFTCPALARTGHFMHVPSTTSWSPSQTCSSRVLIVSVNSVGALYMCCTDLLYWCIASGLTERAVLVAIAVCWLAEEEGG